MPKFALAALFTRAATPALSISDKPYKAVNDVDFATSHSAASRRA